MRGSRHGGKETIDAESLTTAGGVIDQVSELTNYQFRN
jgi:hypothetical protein